VLLRVPGEVLGEGLMRVEEEMTMKRVRWIKSICETDFMITFYFIGGGFPSAEEFVAHDTFMMKDYPMW